VYLFFSIISAHSSGINKAGKKDKELKDMNCCKDNNKEERSLTTGNLEADSIKPEESEHSHDCRQAPAHNHKGHLLHMALCCGLPLLLLLVLPIFGYKGFLQSIIPFICPVMMLVMMPMMMRGHRKSN
jgi:hypothetical protein